MSKETLLWVQYIASLIDIVAACLFAHNIKWIRPARFLIITANVIWIAYGLKTEQYGIAAMNTVYFISVCYGLWNFKKKYDEKIQQI